ncbi:MAG: MOSC domain-containing protein, partial [Brachybacterium sp.]|nr:MOSC domain-containing protein [Brachybacterium sp.]
IRELGLYADVQADRAHHGGTDQAVYLYAAEEADHWAAHLGREIPPGTFGENLRIRGLAVDDLEIGARLRVGSAALEVTAPRTPCATFERWMGVDGFRAAFHERARTGAYCRVLTPGEVRAEDTIEVIDAPGHGVSAARTYASPRDVEIARRLRDFSTATGTALHAELDRRCERLLSRAR